ncbi:MAG TPA: metallopeptidase family protein [Actinomycetota bacterium]|nr:metallopeptidase family protein [Actinomycetota bacterium]
MPRISRKDFESVVEETLDALPESIAEAMSNVQVVVEDRPPADLDFELEGGTEGLLGLYQGIPLTGRTDANYYGVLPDRITLFQRNLERIASSDEHLRSLIRETVIHELAHHFGIDDDRLEELGWA